VENLARILFQTGMLSGFDFTSTVFNFMLSSGTILNTDPAPTTSTITLEWNLPVLARRLPLGSVVRASCAFVSSRTGSFGF
jgi:hypothetical protein